MSGAQTVCTLEDVLVELGTAARLVGGNETTAGREIIGAQLWFAGDPPPADSRLLIVCPRNAPIDEGVEHPLTVGQPSLLIALPDHGNGDTAAEALARAGHVVIATDPTMNAASVISAVARMTRPSEEQRIGRKLASLQRNLSEALSDPTPMAALLIRLKRACNATIALIDRHGDVIEATGPLPLGLVQKQLSATLESALDFDVDGWRGAARQVVDSLDGQAFGWLVAMARRSTFPDPIVRAAVDIAATLAETTHRIAIAERTQIRAIRASVLEQLLALHVAREDPDLSGRLAGLGLHFDDELRIVIIRPVHRWPPQRRSHVPDIGVRIAQLLGTADVSQLLTLRDDHVVVLAQASPATMRRLLIAADVEQDAQIGVGRCVTSVTDVVDSYNDAQLAVRAMQRQPARNGFVIFEDFDFATRLFSHVGLDRMVTWAEEFFEPLRGRHALMAAVRAYFAEGQNIKAAANSLFVHHNSLRYRLAKVEELLGVSLTDPAAVASTYLALAALDLVGERPTEPPLEASRRGPAAIQSDLVATEAETDLRSPSTGDLGVAFGPDR